MTEGTTIALLKYMTRISLVLVFLFAVGCSTTNNVRMADDQYVVTVTDKSLGGDSASVIAKVMKAAGGQCGETTKVQVVNLNTTPSGFGTFPTGTLIYRCI